MALKILMIDDVALIRDQMLKLLREAGYEPYGAANGVEGVEYLAAHRDIALVITDEEMPVMGGVDLFKQCKKHLGDHCPAFVLLTGSNNIAAMQEAKALGFRDVLVKPPDFERLMGIIGEVESASGPPAPAAATD